MVWTGTNLPFLLQYYKEEILLLKFFKNIRHTWIGHTIGHNEFVVNIPEGAISGKKRTWEDLDYNTQSKSPETQALTVIKR